MQASTNYFFPAINNQNSTNLNIYPNQLQPKLIQLVFIDSQVEDYNFLVNNVLSSNRVFVINNANDGIIQISEILKDYQQKYDTSSIAINIIAHGSPGAIKIGNQTLHLANLEEYREYLASWQAQSISLYSCAVGAGDLGLRFIEKLEEITGSEVLASDQLVGHADLGGSWQLRVKREGISNIIPFNTVVVKNYTHVLGILDWSNPAYSWTPGSLNNTYQISGITLTMDVIPEQDANGKTVLVSTFPKIGTQFAGGFSSSPNSLIFEIDPDNNNDLANNPGVRLRVRFNQVVNNVNFQLYDLDRWDIFGWQDQVTISGLKTESGITTSVSPVFMQSPNTNGPSYTITDLINGVVVGKDRALDTGIDSDRGNLGINFNQPITEFSIYFNDGPLALSNPQQHGISLLSTMIFNNQVSLSPPNITRTEESGGTSQNYIYTVSLSDPSYVPITVSYSTSDGTATNGIGYDYIGQTGTLSFLSLDSKVTLDLKGSNVDLTNFDLNPTLTGIQSTRTTTQGSYSVNSAGQLIFAPSGSYRGTATLPYVYTNSGILVTSTINIDITKQLITIPVLGDDVDEPNEFFNITLNTATNATIKPGFSSAIGSIIDNDPSPPDAIDDLTSTVRNQPITFNITNNDIDVDGSITGVDLNPNQPGIQNTATITEGTFSVDNSVNLVFTPVNGFLGTANLPYKAFDDDGGADTANISIVVTEEPPINQPPVANNDTTTTNGNEPITLNILNNDSDPDGNITAIDLDPETPGNQNEVTTPQGTFSVDPSGNLTFTPASDFTGTATLPYTIFDNSGETDTANISIVVTEEPAVNEPPIANDDTKVTGQNIPVTLNILNNDSDPDGSITAIDLNPNEPGLQNTYSDGQGIFSVDNDGNLIFTPNSTFTGVATLSYQVIDNNGETSNNANVNITVAEIPEPPITPEPPIVTPEPETNQAPVANNDSTTITSNQTVTLDILVNDNDPDGSITAVDLAPNTAGIQNQVTTAQGTFSLDNSQNLVFTPVSDFTGVATVSYQIFDNDGATDQAVISIQVNPENIPVEPEIECDCSCPEIPVLEQLDLKPAPVILVPPTNPVDANINGTENNDNLIGSDANEQFLAGNGDDFIDGQASNDNIFGGFGNDSIEGGIGTDYLNGKEDNDTIHGGDDNDFIHGGKGNDLVYAELGNDTIIGEQGEDTLWGGTFDNLDESGQDLISGGEDNDLIYGNQANDTLIGDAGDDWLQGGKDDDLMYGESGNDTLIGELGNDTLIGDPDLSPDANSFGADVLYGEEGNDILAGGRLNDTLFGGKDNDWIYGGKDNDLIYGELGNDTLFGQQGDDTLLGGNSNATVLDLEDEDLLFGAGGNDLINGFYANDTIMGGKDQDQLFGGKGLA